MKKSLVLFGFICAFVVSSFAQQEILIIGTMHQVPGIVKNAYRPMLKKAKAYQPDAVYVERIPAWDTVSMKHYYSRFLARVDTLRLTLTLDEIAVQTALARPIAEQTTEDFELLKQHYTLGLDYANTSYYDYLAKYGIEGIAMAKNRGHENSDISVKLAAAMGHHRLFSMDNQVHYKDYSKAWRACAKDDKTSEDKGAKRVSRQLVGLSIEEGVNGIFGNLGKYTNRQKTTRAYHELNSFRYRETPCQACEDGKMYWDKRNLYMARNIGNQVLEHGHQRSVVVVGAGHVEGLQEALAAEFPDLKVRLYREL